MAITLATAWSDQFPQLYHAFPSPMATPQIAPSPMAFRPFFHEPLLPPRYFVHQPQFRQPLELYQPPTPPPTAAVMRPKLQLSRVLPTPPAPRPVTTADVHHHVFYYYFYLPARDETAPTTGLRNGGGQSARQPCGDLHPITTSECPPAVYLPPPPSPTPPTPPPTPTSTTTSLPPPPPQAPCDDDTVVVDNVNYYPFGRAPIVVQEAAKSVRDGSVNTSRDGSSEQLINRGHNSQPNFILANYLLPPDK